MSSRLGRFRAHLADLALPLLAPERRFSLGSKIVITSVLTTVVGFLAILAFIERITRTSVYDEIDMRVSVAQNTLRHLVHTRGMAAIVDNELCFGTEKINDNRIVDLAKAIAGADATIFQTIAGKPIRLATTILKANGSELNVGTELTGPARSAYETGRNFVGVSPVAGRNFINRYEIVRNADGQSIGLLYSGIPLTTMYAAQFKIMRTMLAAAGLALTICAGLMWLVTRPMRHVFQTTVSVAQGLARGDVLQQTGKVTNDEVGDLNAALGDMIAYQQRMAQVADAIADGDLTVQIAPVSSTDRLGMAFSRMLGNTRSLVEQLGSLALTDGLTQIGNVRAFQEAIHIEASRAQRYHSNISLVIVDIDNFKHVNDRQGHQHGDSVLVRLAELLRTLRVQDCAYRIGGDEFAVILVSTNTDEARVAMERIREQAPARLFGATLTIGLATSDGELDAAVLQRRADIALYAGKRRGRNSVVAFSDTHTMEFEALPEEINDRPLV